MIAILPSVDRVICSSKVDILSSLSAAGRKDMVRDIHGIGTGSRSIQNQNLKIHNQRNNELTFLIKCKGSCSGPA